MARRPTHRVSSNFPNGVTDHLHEFSGYESGDFRGRMHRDWESHFTEIPANQLNEFLKSDQAEILTEGRHRLIVIPLGDARCAVKAFGKQSSFKDKIDSSRGSKASRSLEAAAFLKAHGISTPRPIAYFDRWEDATLVESYYLTEYLPDLTSLHDELVRIFHHEARCDVLVELLEAVAISVRKMHDAGFIHRDLGNQNIQLTRDPQGSWEVQIIDLNRGRLKSDLTLKERADDLSRLFLPSMFLRIFAQMYWQEDPPKKFLKLLKRAQSRFMLWHRTRRLRHPFREPPYDIYSDYPAPRDFWVWDEQSAQATIMQVRRERQRFYPWGRNLKMGIAVLKNALPVWRDYCDLEEETFRKKIILKNRIGMALEAADLDMPRQLDLLKDLGTIPVLLRFCHHEGEAQWKRTIEDVRRIRSEGHEVMVALVQDRQAFLDLDSWEAMCRLVFSEIGNEVSMIELCHAVNRTKWGLYSPEEQKALLERVVRVKERYPNVPVSGPACIDFEYYHVFRALEETPDGLHYDALSHHLYVDRRGAPENKQEVFGTIEKATLLRAISRHVKQSEERVIVSETNWPVKGAGIYSPVDATYMWPDQPESDLNVSEDDYGHFMLRYLVLTLCSGHIERVYWWRLVSHGFGLVDELADGGWRKRPGFKMLQQFLSLLGEATFIEKLDTPEDVYAFRFQAGAQKVDMMWSNEEKGAPLTQKYSEILDVVGKPIADPKISGAPLYGVI